MFPQAVYTTFMEMLQKNGRLDHAKFLFPALFKELEAQKSRNECQPKEVQDIIGRIKAWQAMLAKSYAEEFNYLVANFKVTTALHSQPVMGSSTQVQPQPRSSVQNTLAPSTRVVQQPILTTVPQSTRVVQQPILTTVPQLSSPSVNCLQIGVENSTAWKEIEITDLPTGTFGQYKFTENDKFINLPKGSAAAKVKGDKNCAMQDVIKQPEYWAYYGRMVMKGMGKKQFGRCHSCAAAAVYTLVMNPRYDSLDIHVYGIADYDHHFVRVGTRDELNKSGGYVIDIWQANVSKQQGGKDLPYVWEASKYPYGTQNWTHFCGIYTEQRAVLRQYVSQENI